MRRRIMCLLILSAISGSAYGLDSYYYSSGRQIAIELDTLRMLVKSDGLLNPNLQEEFLLSIDRVAAVNQPAQAGEGFLLCSLSTGAGYEQFIDSVQDLDGIMLTEPVYASVTAMPVYVGDVFIVAFNPSVHITQIDSINSVFGVTLDHQYEGLVNTFILRNTDSTGMHTTELANRYYELPETEWSHPMFTSVIEKHAYQVLDHYAPYQLHSKKVIGQFNQASVWDFAGLRRPVTVAVVDDGIVPHAACRFHGSFRGRISMRTLHARAKTTIHLLAPNRRMAWAVPES